MRKYPYYEEIDIDGIMINDWNDNVVPDDVFSMLLDNIEQGDFVAPILVVPVEDDAGELEYYRIINGEHRFEACRQMGFSTIPCMVADPEKYDLKMQKIQTVRQNQIHGYHDQEKFKALVKDLIENHEVSEGAIMQEMGFTEINEWEALVGTFREVVPPEQRQEFDKRSKTAKSVEELQSIVESLLNRFGDTVPANFMIFDLGRKRHIWIDTPPKSVNLIIEKFRECMEEGYTVSSMLIEMLASVDIPSFVEQRQDHLEKIQESDDRSLDALITCGTVHESL